MKLPRRIKTERIGSVLARRVNVSNPDREAIDFDAKYRPEIIQEALAPNGTWVAIETPGRFKGSCGCYYTIWALRRGKPWTFMVPVYDGEYTTQLRVRMEPPLGSVCSAAFSGKIQLKQLGLGIAANSAAI